MNASTRLQGADVLPPLTPRQTTTQGPPAESAETARRNGKRQPKRKRSARWTTFNDFIDHTMAHLTPRQVKVWLVLFRDTRSGSASVAQAWIAERTGLKRPTVSGTIAELEELGLVTTVYAGGLNRGLSRYRISGRITR